WGWPEVRDIEVPARGGRDRGPVVRQRNRRQRGAGRLEVVAPDPAAEAELPGLGRLRPGLPGNRAWLVEHFDPVGDLVVLVRVVRVVHRHPEHLTGGGDAIA